MTTTNSAEALPEDNLNHLLSNTDAQAWAAEFKKLNRQCDEGAMLSWFACAIMTGYDEANRRNEADRTARAPVQSVGEDWEFKELLGGYARTVELGAGQTYYAEKLIAHIDSLLAARPSAAVSVPEGVTLHAFIEEHSKRWNISIRHPYGSSFVRMGQPRDDQLAKLIASSASPLPESTRLCWSCRKQFTKEQHAAADGNCPHCGVEIELEDFEPYIPSPPQAEPVYQKLVLALPDYETRKIVVVSDEVINGERLVCVAIKAEPVSTAGAVGYISKGVIEHALSKGFGASTYIQAGRTDEFPVPIYTTPPAVTAPDMSAPYNELIMAVQMKHPGETRHETALRHIREREAPKVEDRFGRALRSRPKGEAQ